MGTRRRARVTGGPAFAIDDADLPELPQRVSLHHEFEGACRRVTGGEKVDRQWPQFGIDESLARHGADMARRLRTQAADAERVGCDRNSEFATAGATSDHGVGQY